MLEDDQVAQLQPTGLEPMESTGFTLFTNVCSKRDSMGESRHTLSWIWLTGSSADHPDNATDHILQVEWAKSRAHAARASEEVLLLREKMRRVLKYLKWKGDWWTSQEA